ncbi:hypothetical protein OHB41_20960 [Streptomyces sp. NBC_01571]|uniref:hypothetical protein n=1 Tax=Streptomyces sp. NBC_01571 TaxID=2975883 RepID=UPI00225BECA2|nr:hypothetical protein [Streptomyces sp. NBC_01571]MCX4575614.1 hypothetical protein [Streptomyces sp. NBC_01571]
MTNRYTVEAPVRTFSGESVGVQFSKGTGHVDDSTKDGRAAIEYFRRQGYALTPEGGPEAEDNPQPPAAITPATEYDPSKHNQDEVLAYLDSLANKDSDSDAEYDRVIAAERDGKARKSILARGEQKQGDEK